MVNEMKIVVIGCGNVGKSITKRLCEEGHEVTVIDSSQEVIKDISYSQDVIGVIGNGAGYSVQMEAGVDKCDLLIAATDSDEINLLSCLFAKRAGNCKTIARVRNPLYRDEAAYIKEELALSLIINPEYDTATEMTRVLRFPSADKIDTFANGKVELLKFAVSKGSILHGKSLLEVGKTTKSKVLICAVLREDKVYIPYGGFILNEGDIVAIIAKPQDARKFFEWIKVDTHHVKDTLIVGGGKIAFYLANQLIKSGIDVKIIESDKDRCNELSELLPKATVINGDALNKGVLLEEGIKEAESIVLLTGSDESNVFLSLFAEKVSKAKIITKINKLGFMDIYTSLQSGSIMCPKSITSDNVLSYVRARQNTLGSNVETMVRVLDNRVEALEFKINKGSKAIGVPLMNLSMKRNILIACVNRGGNIIIANGQTVIEEEDTVVVITDKAGLDDFEHILL